jgi:hypothetical protein
LPGSWQSRSLPHQSSAVYSIVYPSQLERRIYASCHGRPGLGFLQFGAFRPITFEISGVHGVRNAPPILAGNCENSRS